MICPKCKNENPDDALYCAICSEVFRKKAQQAPVEPIEPPATPGKPTSSRFAKLATVLQFKKTLICCALVLAYLIIPAKLLRSAGVPVPVKAGEFTVKGLDGKRINLSDFAGRPVLLYVWMTNCPRSIDNLGMISALYQKYRNSPLCFLPVTLNPDFKTTVAPFVASHGIEYPVYNGHGYLTRQFWPAGIPGVFLIDRQGYLHQEFSPDKNDQAKLESYIDRYIADRTPESYFVDMGEPQPDLTDARDGYFSILKQAQQLLEDENYAGLDVMADELRATKARFANGDWKLVAYYEGVSSIGTNIGRKEEEWERRLPLLKKWKEVRPASITAAVAYGGALVNYAWYARGSGYAAETPEEDMALFKQRLLQAKQALEEADKLPGKCPMLYDQLMTAALGEGAGADEQGEIFRKAVAFAPDYYHYYEEFGQALWPIWYGAPGDVEQFAENMAKATKDAEGMGIYTRIMVQYAMGTTLFGENGEFFFKRTNASWPLMRQGFLDIDKRYPDSRVNLNEFAWLACLAGDKTTAKTIFARLGGDYDKKVWSGLTYARWMTWAQKEQKGTFFERIKNLL